MQPAAYSQTSSTAAASTKRRQDAASGGMCWATMRPLGQEAPQSKAMPIKRRCEAACGPKVFCKFMCG